MRRALAVLREVCDWAVVAVMTLLALTGLVVWVMVGVRLAGGSAERFARAMDNSSSEDCPASTQVPHMPHYYTPKQRGT